MATKDVQPLPANKRKPMPRHFSADDNVHELLALLRNQEESPDKALLNDTKCLLSLSLDRNTMPPLPSIKSKTTTRQGTEERGKADKTNTTSTAEEGSFETTTPSDDEVSDATQSPTFAAVSNTNTKMRLPSLGSREEAGTTGISKTAPQPRKT
ncbi:Hypothetical predicted protein [Paramuricea clavata]|uniref:Uncharacterized protein n=1 Tax=Paramuricea clavata TaxID=317549 RepID=A0A7D9J022_PARCT|nr:Hypothetical predicted protein [Paramuricea clavata]